MQQLWTLNVGGFGKLEEAQLRLAPFMLVVGEHATEKNHLMTLLWGIFSHERKLFPKQLPTSQEYKTCLDFLCEQPDFITKELEEALLAWVNSLLARKKTTLARKFLSFEDAEIEHLSISDYVREEPFNLNWKKAVLKGKSLAEKPSDEQYLVLQKICWGYIFGGLKKKAAGIKPLYLPATRSGLMLSYPSLVSDVMQAWSGEQVKTRFSLPVIDFLQNLAITRQDKKRKKHFRPVTKFLQTNLLKGRTVKNKQAGVNSYEYLANNSEESLPFHTVAAEINQLAPLLILLRARTNFNALIIEEPEVHLSLEQQDLFVQALVRLVNLGVPVWCTTSSDRVIEQVNSLIKQDFNATMEDILPLNAVRVFECSSIDGEKVKITQQLPSAEEF